MHAKRPEGPALSRQRPPMPARAMPAQVKLAHPVYAVPRADRGPTPITGLIHLPPPAAVTRVLMGAPPRTRDRLYGPVDRFTPLPPIRRSDPAAKYDQRLKTRMRASPAPRLAPRIDGGSGGRRVARRPCPDIRRRAVRPEGGVAWMGRSSERPARPNPANEATGPRASSRHGLARIAQRTRSRLARANQVNKPSHHA